jgi:hypothetical protein
LLGRLLGPTGARAGEGKEEGVVLGRMAGPSGWAARPSSLFLLFFSIFHFFFHYLNSNLV